MAVVTAVFTAFVIFAGAMVVATGSGMSVPDWPLSFGTWMPVMKGGVFFEHGHRMVAGTLGVFVLVLAVMAAFKERRAWARAFTWGALIVLLCQVLLGGMAVLRGTYFGWSHTAPDLTMMHAVMAQVLFATLVAYATVCAPGWESRQARLRAPAGLAWAAAGLMAVVFVQIIVGAVMRHRHAGLAILGFPLNSGRVIPVFYNFDVVLNFAHRMGGWFLVLVGGGFALSLALRKDLDSWARKPAAFFVGAVVAQFFLGAAVVLTHIGIPVLDSLHVVGGSMLLGASVVLALRLGSLASPGGL